MIEIRLIEEKSCPVIVCDACGNLIKDPTMALVRYQMDLKQGQSGKISYSHKLGCDEMLDAAQGKESWRELPHFLIELCHNAGFPLDAMQKESSRLLKK